MYESEHLYRFRTLSQSYGNNMNVKIYYFFPGIKFVSSSHISTFVPKKNLQQKIRNNMIFISFYFYV